MVVTALSLQIAYAYNLSMCFIHTSEQQKRIILFYFLRTLPNKISSSILYFLYFNLITIDTFFTSLSHASYCWFL